MGWVSVIYLSKTPQSHEQTLKSHVNSILAEAVKARGKLETADGRFTLCNTLGMSDVRLTIDGQQVTVQRGTTIWDAAKEAGIDIRSELDGCLVPAGTGNNQAAFVLDKDTLLVWLLRMEMKAN